MRLNNLSSPLVGMFASARRFFLQFQTKLALSSAIAVIDYGLVSLTKFFISVFLGRATSPNEFGVFVLAYSALVLYNSVQIGLVGEAFTVLAAPLDDQDFARYLATAAAFILSLAVLLGGLTTGLIILLRPVLDAPAFLTFLNLGWVSVTVLAQDFFRRVLFSRQKSSRVLINDLLLAVIQIVGLFWLIRRDILTANQALIVIGIGSGTAALLGLFQARKLVNLPLTCFRPEVKSLAHLWKYGRWSLGAQLAFNFSTMGYLYASGILLGTAAAGALKACQNIVAPIQIFLIGLDSLLMAVGSHRYQRGGMKDLNALLWPVGIILIIFTATYGIGISIFARPVLDWLYKGQYSAFSLIVVFYALYQLFFAASRPFAIGLRSLQKPVRIFQGYLVASALAVIGLYPLVRYFGANGAAFGTSVTELAFAFFVAYSYVVLKRQQPQLREASDG